jgi:hypothetical protein
MSLNYKKKAVKKNDNRITLVEQHTKKINEINKIENSLPSLVRELKKNKAKYDLLYKSNNGFGSIEKEKGREMYLLNNKIKELNTIIENINCNNIKDNYYSKTAHILYKYYNDIQVVSNRHNENTDFLIDSKKEYIQNISPTIQPISIVPDINPIIQDKRNLNILNKKLNIKINDKNNIIDILKKKKSYSSTKISDFLEMEEKSNRADLLDSYNKIINPLEYKPIKKNKKIEIDICKLCNIEMNLIQSEGLVVCFECGREEHILIDSDKPSYKDPPPEAGEFTYKRINRFDEWLIQYQAKETTEIPQEVIDSILLEIKKEGITNLCNISMDKVRRYLKKLNLNKYYEHIPHIIYCLNGLPTPRLTQEIEEKLRSMFRQIQDIFDIVCPENRTNFLSYSYLLRKLLELLGEYEHMKYFRLHKSREKIYQHDKVWEKICHLLKWDYIRTV